MFAYIIRRLLLIVPTLFGIMVLNFVIIHSAPGGPVEQLLAKLQQTDVSATERFSGGGDQREVEASKQQSRMPAAAPSAPTVAPAASIPSSSRRSSASSASTSPPTSASSS